MSVSSARRGRVILLGAGPGDPDLVTVRGMNALCEADAVVYDAWAPKELLDFAPAGAALHDVGKHGDDAPTLTLPEIAELLVALAREGKTVVRLEVGDPFVFGRGGEEATACVEAGVDFEVTVTGIDKEVVGQFAAKVRKIRKPDLYKGKGIRYRGEYVRKLAGKTFGTAGA